MNHDRVKYCNFIPDFRIKFWFRNRDQNHGNCEMAAIAAAVHQLSRAYLYAVTVM